MASMERDVELKEAPFHLAGYIMVYQFSKAAGIDAEGFVPEHFRSIVCLKKIGSLFSILSIKLNNC